MNKDGYLFLGLFNSISLFTAFFALFSVRELQRDLSLTEGFPLICEETDKIL